MKLVNKELIEGIKCKPISLDKIDFYEKDVIPEMKKILLHHYGLALPQIGTFRNMFIMKYNHKIISCYNPTWKPKTSKKTMSEESCLSYPKLSNKVYRYKMIYTEFINNKGEIERLKLRGLDAIIFQHEADHLVGITIFNKKIGEK